MSFDPCVLCGADVVSNRYHATFIDRPPNRPRMYWRIYCYWLCDECGPSYWSLDDEAIGRIERTTLALYGKLYGVDKDGRPLTESGAWWRVNGITEP